MISKTKLLTLKTIHPCRCIHVISMLVLLMSCSNRPEETDTREVATNPVRLTAAVTSGIKTMTAEQKTFVLQVLSNGKLNAARQSNLQFKTTGIIERIFVTNGSTVRAGQAIAQLDNQAQHMAVRHAENQLAEAQINVRDYLVRSGGKASDSASVKPEIWRFIKIESGYNKAVINMQEARLKLQDTYLRAPYNGIIANLNAKPYNPVPADKPFCTLLSANAFVVGFPVLESELAAVQIGQSAQVTPVALPGKTYHGRVSEINPFVSEQGLVQIKVTLTNPDKHLLEGMNARVVVEKNVSRQIVIPKEAVVERAGRKVVFTYQNGLAKWNYVTVGHENSAEVAISEGLKAGDQVIVEGNLNLGHDAPVQVSTSTSAKQDQ